MSNEKRMKEDFEKAIREAAAEHYFFIELKADLAKLRWAEEEKHYKPMRKLKSRKKQNER